MLLAMLADRSFEHHSKICPALAALGADISRQTNEIVAALARERITCNGRTTPDGLIDTFQKEGLQSPSVIVVGDVVQGARAWQSRAATSADLRVA